MVAEDLAHPRVAALDLVAGGRDWPASGNVVFQEGGQRALSAQLLREAPGLPEPLVLVLLPAADDGPPLEKLAPPGAPVVERHEQAGGPVLVGDARRVLRDSVELDPGLQLRARRRASPHLLEGVEGASLDARAGPIRAPRLLDTAAPVAHEHVGRSDARHQAVPVPGVLGACEAAADREVAGARDRQH